MRNFLTMGLLRNLLSMSVTVERQLQMDWGRSSCAIQAGFRMNSQPLSWMRFAMSFLQASLRRGRSSSCLSTCVKSAHLDGVELGLLLRTLALVEELLAG